MSRDTLHPAYILHRRPYSNTSLLLELFAPELGRLPALAKGAVAPRRSQSALLQPFQPLLIRLGGGGEVKTLIHSEADRAALPLRARRLYCGFYLNELLVRLLPRHDPHPPLYHHYASALQQLVEQEALEPTLRRFEMILLQQLGYAPTFDRLLGSQEPLQAESWYHYSIEEGALPTTADRPAAVRGRTLLALAGGRRELGREERQQARQLMRTLLQHYLGERPLKSRELFL